MNRKGFLAFSYVDLQSWIGFFFITVLAFLLFQTLIEDPESVNSASLSIDDQTTLSALLNTPLDPTYTFSDLLIRSFNEYGPAKESNPQTYILLHEALDRTLTSMIPDKMWVLRITDQKGVLQLLLLRRKNPPRDFAIPNDVAALKALQQRWNQTFVYLPTNRPDHPTIKLTLQISDLEAP